MRVCSIYEVFNVPILQDIELTSSVYDNHGFDDNSIYQEEEKNAERRKRPEVVLPKPDETIRIYQFEEPSNR